jgi:hypothetical protein
LPPQWRQLPILDGSQYRLYLSNEIAKGVFRNAGIVVKYEEGNAKMYQINDERVKFANGSIRKLAQLLREDNKKSAECSSEESDNPARDCLEDCAKCCKNKCKKTAWPGLCRFVCNMECPSMCADVLVGGEDSQDNEFICY